MQFNSLSDQPSASLSTPQINPGPTHPGKHLQIHCEKTISCSAFSSQTGHTVVVVVVVVVVVIEVSQKGGNLISSKFLTPYTKFILLLLYYYKNYLHNI